MSEPARTMQWLASPRSWRPPSRWSFTAIGTLAPGEKPIGNDELVRLEPDGRVWRVGEAASHVDVAAGTVTVTLHLVDPATTMP